MLEEILKLAQKGALPDQIADELEISSELVYRSTPSEWYADPKADSEMLSEKPLSIMVRYFDMLKNDAGPHGHYTDEQRLIRKLRKCWLKSFNKYHGTKMDIY